MSVSVETTSALPQEAAFQNANYLRNQALCVQPFIQLMEGQILSMQMARETLGSLEEMARFDSLKYSNSDDRDLYYGNSATQGNKQIIMMNGFVPFNFMTENPFAAPFVKSLQNSFPTLKSNAFLEKKRQWYERHGHNTQFGFDGPNHIWFKNFQDGLTSTMQAIAASNDPDQVWLDGLSAGGMLAEMIAKKLAKEDIAVNIITHGSPEVNEEILSIFEDSRKYNGIMGQVHGLAKMSAQLDPNFNRMQEEIYDAAHGQFHPLSKVVRFYSQKDSIVPPPQDPHAIEVGGYHAVIPYRKRVLQFEQELLKTM